MIDTFDIAIIGGGILGSGIAHECALRGLSVVLFEKGDFSSQTSAGSFKIVHGGLRYLQHLDIKRLRESAEEQYLLRRNAPHLLRPLPFLVPCYGYGKKGRFALDFACSVYEFLTKSRNRNLPEDLCLSDHKCLSAEEVISIAPHIPRSGLRGGVVFYDCQMKNSDRLSLAVVKSAERAGAVVKNYHEVVEIESVLKGSERKIDSLKVKNVLSGTFETLTARFVINTMGPWAEHIFSLFSDFKEGSAAKQKTYYSKGIQLVLPEIIRNYAVSIESRGSDTASHLRRGGRAFFLQPWNGKTLLGTTDTIYSGDPAHFEISGQEVKHFLDEVRQVYPSDLLSSDRVEYAFGGLRAISREVHEAILRGEDRDGFVNTTRDETIVDHSKEIPWGYHSRVGNLISVIGVKYTTFRSVSEEIGNMLKEKGFQLTSRSTRDISYYGAPEVAHFGSMGEQFRVKFSALLHSLGENQFSNLVQEYGLEAEVLLCQIEGYLRDERVSPEMATLRSKIRYALEKEYAKTLDDLLFRRLSESSHSFPGTIFIDTISKILLEEHKFTPDNLNPQIQRAIKRYDKVYKFQQV